MIRSIGWSMLFVTAWVVGCGSSTDPAEPMQPAPPALLTRRDAEPAGQNCPLGGTAIRAGLDRNGDGILEDSEIDHTDYLCNSPTTVLVRKDPLPPSIQCPDGGVAVQTGVDKNGDGILQDAEIDHTTPVCNSLELWEGDFTENDWSDPIKVAALQGARVVVGSLTINASGPVTLPALEMVTGDLFSGSPASVPTLPVLHQVGGTLVIGTGASAPELPRLFEVDGNVVASTGSAALDLPMLFKIGGSLGVTPATAAVTFDVLDEVHGQVNIHGDSALVDAPRLRVVDGSIVTWFDARGVLSLPDLQTVGGDVDVRGPLTGLHADSMVSIGGSISIDSGGTATLALALPALQTIAGNVTAIFEKGVTSIDLPQLQQCGGTLELLTPAGLTEVSLPRMLSVGGDIWISDAQALVAVDVGALTTVGGAMTIERAPALSTLPVAALHDVGSGQTFPSLSIELLETALQDLDFASLHSVSKEIFLGENPMLRTVQFPNLTTAETLAADALDSIAAPQLTAVQGCHLGGSFHTFDLGALQSVDFLEIDGAAVSDLSGLHSLSRVGSMKLQGLTQLQDLRSLTSLRNVATLNLIDNPALASLDGLEHVTEISDSVRLTGNALASVAGLRNVTQVGNMVMLNDEVALASIELTGLVSIGGSPPNGGLFIEDLPGLTTLSGFSALTSVGGDLEILEVPLSADDINAFRQRLGR